MQSFVGLGRCLCSRSWLFLAALTVAACGDANSSDNDDTNAPVSPANPDPNPEWVEQITVVKHVEGGGFVASDFTMTVTVDGVAQSFPGSEAGTTVEVEPGTFEVTEDGPTGYEASFSADCSGTIGEGDQKTCVVTNTAIDKCAGVVCIRWAPECGGVGTCNPNTGECEFPDSPEGLPCNDDGNICTIDVCNAEGYCVHPPGNEGTLCRESEGVCDVAEYCTGESVFCPNDGFLPDDTVCREAEGVCDVEELCTGQSAECPPDYFAGTDVECRPAVDELCDISEVCTGESAECPPDVFSPAGIECRPASGDCDTPEVCTGESGACPPDGVAPEGLLCREAAGVCDLAEYCDGVRTDCPTDVYDSGTICRESADGCDPAEVCSGTSVACPDDDYADCMLCGDKYYDANNDGILDPMEGGLPDWLIELTFDSSTLVAATDTNGRYVFEDLTAGTYYVCEQIPVETNWVQTAPPTGCYEVVVPLADAEDCLLDFGNHCINGGGGHTPGFWSGPNGEALFDEEARLLLVDLNLVDADGNPFDPATHTELAAWLQGRSSENMAYMLSAHLAAMTLNVWAGFVDPYELIYAPGTNSADENDIASIGEILEEANLALGVNGYTPEGDADRDYQEDLKDALDGANNNSNYVDGSECYYTFES